MYVRCELLMPWKQWGTGHVFDNMSRGMARVLQSRGIGKILDEEPPATPEKRKRGRPRKNRDAAVLQRHAHDGADG